MKKLYVISLILYLCCKTIVGSAQSNTTFIRWNSTLGVSIGYSNLHKPFKKEYHGHKAPTDLLQIDASILGLYVGTSFMSRKTGYDVYGFAERISTLGIKIGPSIRIGEYYWWRCVINPFVGMIRYSVKDDSNNSIGARDEYGTKEKSFIGGCKISAVYRNWMLGVNYSNREYGITLGFDIPCFL